MENEDYRAYQLSEERRTAIPRRSIYRAQDGESSLYFGVSREYMVGIFESWGENIKTGHVGLMPKL